MPGGEAGRRPSGARERRLVAAVLFVAMVLPLVFSGARASNEVREGTTPEGEGRAASADDAWGVDAAGVSDPSAVGGPSDGSGEEASRTFSVEGGLPSVARSVLEGYRDDEGTALVRAGYVDLLGRVWSCTVRGQGWVDTCIVQESDGSGECRVSVIRLEVDEWEESYDQEMS